MYAIIQDDSGDSCGVQGSAQVQPDPQDALIDRIVQDLPVPVRLALAVGIDIDN